MILGLDVGGTNTDIVAYQRGKFRHLGTFKTHEVIDQLEEVVNAIAPNVEAVGVGIAVWIKGGEFIHAPNLPSVPSFKFSKPHIFENDANCFAFFAFMEFGWENVLAITVGTGIGGGIIAGGKIYRGSGIAGEIGHTFAGGERMCRCGKKGCLETHFGGWSLREFEGDPEELIASGEIYSRDGFEKFCIAIANAVMLLNPQTVVLGGRIGSRLNAKTVEKRVMKYLPEVSRPEFYVLRDDYAIAKGAALLASITLSADRP